MKRLLQRVSALKPTRVMGIVLMAAGALGVVLLMSDGDTHCTFLTEVFAQLRLCGSEYATEVRQLRVLPVAFFVGLFGIGVLLTSR